MNTDEVKSAYKRDLPEMVAIRRYSGSGDSRVSADYAASARVTGYAPHELVGNIVQGDRRAIVFSDDLVAAGMSLPVTTGDRLVVGGKELAIKAVDHNTRCVNGALIAIEIQAAG